MKILFTICGRAGSKGFRNKNLKRMKDTPLVFYTLAAIKGFAESNFDYEIQVVLNTDSEPLRALLENQNEIPVRYIARKEELAGDTVPKVDVIKDSFINCSDFNPDVVVDLDITSPVRKIKDIENVISVYSKGCYDLVFSVVNSRRNPYFNMVENKKDGYYRKICESNFTARQQAPSVFELNASIYAYNPNFLRGEIDKTILEYNCGISIMHDYLVLDIDSEEDFEMMEYLYDYYCKVDAELKTVYDIAKRLTF